MRSTKNLSQKHKLMFPPIGGNLITFRPEGMEQKKYREIQRAQKLLIKQRKRGWYVQHNQHINKIHGPVKYLAVA